MTSADFALAQQRLEARRRLREAEAQARLEQQRSSPPSSASSRLPFPFSRIQRAGLQTWDGIRGREGTRPAFRVGQVDAELLDEELQDLLKAQVGEALKYFGSHLQDEWSSEILLVLRAILFKLTIWDHNATYGAALQNLRYTDARNRKATNAPPTRWQKSLYGLFTVGGRYAWNKWEDWLVEQEGGYDEVLNHLRTELMCICTLLTDVAQSAGSPTLPHNIDCLYHALHCCLHIFPCIPRQWTIPNTHRSYTPSSTYPSLEPSKSRGIVRIP